MSLPLPQIPAAAIPSRVGVGLRTRHVPEFLSDRPKTAWLEVHSENYLGAGGPRLAALLDLRRDYPLSCHGVGLSLGSAEGLSDTHLADLRRLFDIAQPGLVSEHVAWSVESGHYLNDLLPLPYTEEALEILVRNIQRAQEAFGRRILVENPSSYIAFDHSTIPEWQFMAEAANRSGCGLLLDVNNIHVSAHNHRFSAREYLDAVPLEKVGEIHVAGHAVREFGGQKLLIDDHGSPVNRAVWDLFAEAISRLGPTPTLVEWDTDVPELSVLLAEQEKAQAILDRAGKAQAA